MGRMLLLKSSIDFFLTKYAFGKYTSELNGHFIVEYKGETALAKKKMFNFLLISDRIFLKSPNKKVLKFHCL